MDPNISAKLHLIHGTESGKQEEISNRSTIGSDNKVEFTKVTKSRLQTDSFSSAHSGGAAGLHETSLNFHDSLDATDDTDVASENDDGSSTSTESLIERSRKYLDKEAGIIILKRRKPKNFDINIDFEVDGGGEYRDKRVRSKITGLNQASIEGGDSKKYLTGGTDEFFQRNKGDDLNWRRIAGSGETYNDSLKAQIQRMDQLSNILNESIGKENIRDKENYYRRTVDNVSSIGGSGIGGGGAGAGGSSSGLPIVTRIAPYDDFQDVGNETFIEESIDEGKLVLYLTERQVRQLLRQRAIIVPNRRKLLLDEKADSKTIYLLDQQTDSKTVVWQDSQHQHQQQQQQQQSSSQSNQQQSKIISDSLTKDQKAYQDTIYNEFTSSSGNRQSPFREVNVYVKTSDDTIPLPNVLNNNAYLKTYESSYYGFDAQQQSTLSSQDQSSYTTYDAGQRGAGTSVIDNVLRQAGDTTVPIATIYDQSQQYYGAQRQRSDQVFPVDDFYRPIETSTSSSVYQQQTAPGGTFADSTNTSTYYKKDLTYPSYNYSSTTLDYAPKTSVDSSSYPKTNIPLPQKDSTGVTSSNIFSQTITQPVPVTLDTPSSSSLGIKPTSIVHHTTQQQQQQQQQQSPLVSSDRVSTSFSIPKTVVTQQQPSTQTTTLSYAKQSTLEIPQQQTTDLLTTQNFYPIKTSVQSIPTTIDKQATTISSIQEPKLESTDKQTTGITTTTTYIQPTKDSSGQIWTASDYAQAFGQQVNVPSSFDRQTTDDFGRIAPSSGYIQTTQPKVDSFGTYSQATQPKVDNFGTYSQATQPKVDSFGTYSQTGVSSISDKQSTIISSYPQQPIVDSSGKIITSSTISSGYQPTSFQPSNVPFSLSSLSQTQQQASTGQPSTNAYYSQTISSPIGSSTPHTKSQTGVASYDYQQSYKTSPFDSYSQTTSQPAVSTSTTYDSKSLSTSYIPQPQKPISSTSNLQYDYTTGDITKQPLTSYADSTLYQGTGTSNLPISSSVTSQSIDTSTTRTPKQTDYYYQGWPTSQVSQQTFQTTSVDKSQQQQQQQQQPQPQSSVIGTSGYQTTTYSPPSKVPSIVDNRANYGIPPKQNIYENNLSDESKTTKTATGLSDAVSPANKEAIAVPPLSYPSDNYYQQQFSNNIYSQISPTKITGQTQRTAVDELDRFVSDIRSSANDQTQQIDWSSLAKTYQEKLPQIENVYRQLSSQAQGQDYVKRFEVRNDNRDASQKVDSLIQQLRQGTISPVGDRWTKLNVETVYKGDDRSIRSPQRYEIRSDDQDSQRILENLADKLKKTDSWSSVSIEAIRKPQPEQSKLIEIRNVDGQAPRSVENFVDRLRSGVEPWSLLNVEAVYQPQAISQDTIKHEIKRDDPLRKTQLDDVVRKIDQDKDSWSQVRLDTVYKPSVVYSDSQTHSVLSDTRGAGNVLGTLVSEIRRKSGDKLQQLNLETVYRPDWQPTYTQKHVIKGDDGRTNEALSRIINDLQANADKWSQINLEAISRPESSRRYEILNDREKEGARRLENLINGIKKADNWTQISVEVVRMQDGQPVVTRKIINARDPFAQEALSNIINDSRQDNWTQITIDVSTKPESTKRRYEAVNTKDSGALQRAESLINSLKSGDKWSQATIELVQKSDGQPAFVTRYPIIYSDDKQANNILDSVIRDLRANDKWLQVNVETLEKPENTTSHQIVNTRDSDAIKRLENFIDQLKRSNEWAQANFEIVHRSDSTQQQSPVSVKRIVRSDDPHAFEKLDQLVNEVKSLNDKWSHINIDIINKPKSVKTYEFDLSRDKDSIGKIEDLFDNLRSSDSWSQVNLKIAQPTTTEPRYEVIRRDDLKQANRTLDKLLEDIRSNDGRQSKVNVDVIYSPRSSRSYEILDIKDKDAIGKVANIIDNLKTSDKWAKVHVQTTQYDKPTDEYINVDDIDAGDKLGRVVSRLVSDSKPSQISVEISSRPESSRRYEFVNIRDKDAVRRVSDAFGGLRNSDSWGRINVETVYKPTITQSGTDLYQRDSEPGVVARQQFKSDDGQAQSRLDKILNDLTNLDPSSRVSQINLDVSPRYPSAKSSSTKHYQLIDTHDNQAVKRIQDLFDDLNSTNRWSQVNIETISKSSQSGQDVSTHYQIKSDDKNAAQKLSQVLSDLIDLSNQRKLSQVNVDVSNRPQSFKRYDLIDTSDKNVTSRVESIIDGIRQRDRWGQVSVDTVPSQASGIQSQRHIIRGDDSQTDDTLNRILGDLRTLASDNKLSQVHINSFDKPENVGRYEILNGRRRESLDTIRSHVDSLKRSDVWSQVNVETTYRPKIASQVPEVIKYEIRKEDGDNSRFLDNMVNNIKSNEKRLSQVNIQQVYKPQEATLKYDIQGRDPTGLRQLDKLVEGFKSSKDTWSQVNVIEHPRPVQPVERVAVKKDDEQSLRILDRFVQTLKTNPEKWTQVTLDAHYRPKETEIRYIQVPAQVSAKSNAEKWTQVSALAFQQPKSETDSLQILDKFVSRLKQTSPTQTDFATPTLVKTYTRDDRAALDVLDQFIQKLRRILEEWNTIQKRRIVHEQKTTPVVRPQPPKPSTQKVIVKTIREVPGSDGVTKARIRKTTTYSFLEDYKPRTRVYEVLGDYDLSKITEKAVDVYDNPNYSYANYTQQDLKQLLQTYYITPPVKPVNDVTKIVNTGIKNQDVKQVHPLGQYQKTTVNSSTNNASLPSVKTPVIIDSHGYNKYIDEISKHFSGLKVIDFPMYVQGGDVRQLNDSKSSSSHSFLSSTTSTKNLNENLPEFAKHQQEMHNFNFVKVNGEAELRNK